MPRIIRTVALLGGLSFALTACGGGGGAGSVSSVVVTNPTTPTATAFQDRFGTAFSAAFNASATATPNHPAASDVPALSLTTEPLDNS